jgi:hypothetical protein
MVFTKFISADRLAVTRHITDGQLGGTIAEKNTPIV